VTAVQWPSLSHVSIPAADRRAQPQAEAEL